jgi:hypothetical protein
MGAEAGALVRRDRPWRRGAGTPRSEIAARSRCGVSRALNASNDAQSMCPTLDDDDEEYGQ